MRACETAVVPRERAARCVVRRCFSRGAPAWPDRHQPPAAACQQQCAAPLHTLPLCACAAAGYDTVARALRFGGQSCY
jgi:hypothetical protein